ncbi:hypothetical protein OsJ_02156 [Oryza sativa Japonica Group]|uniref:WAT1-related protein n=1 Tax=Oryza sativa subsp. japonica TaxID=39947 RepID=B9EXF5_ORYSJ|nr:hypothetical protein OsJ_02156 [Oryza sativa Japonica Group]
MQIVTKFAFNEGMSTSVFVFYRHVIAILFLVPVAFVLERKTAPPLTFKVSLKLFLHALYGMESLNLKRINGIAKGPMLEVYPSKLLNTTIQIVFATIQCFFIALAIERDFSRWKLHLDMGLIAVIYSGVLVSGVAYYMQVWVIDKSGPVFLAMTMPITLLVTIMLSSFVLGEAVTLGSIISGVVMVGGLYCVLWAKKSEQAAISKQQMP